MSTVNDYLIYVRDVLGARQILGPKPQDAEKSALSDFAHTRTAHWPPAGAMDLLVVHQGAGFFQGEPAELWEKMKSAMNLGSRKVLEIESSPDHEDLDGVVLEALAVYPTPTVLLLTTSPARGHFRTLGTAQVFESFVPSILVGAQDLKRDAWTDLQKVMKELGIGKN